LQKKSQKNVRRYILTYISKKVVIIAIVNEELLLLPDECRSAVSVCSCPPLAASSGVFPIIRVSRVLSPMVISSWVLSAIAGIGSALSSSAPPAK
jgi:hypothetical protein